jgi:TolB protein
VARQFTDGGTLDSRPAWSPEGSRVVFVRDDGRDTWIVGKEIGSGEERVLVDTGAIDLDPVLAEDGTLWYASARENRIEIWSMSPDGTHARRAGQGRVSRRPQPSPDGARLLYKQDSDRLALLDLGTGEEEVLFSGMQWVSQLDAALSPDGRRMAFVVPQGQGDGWELRVASLDRPGGTMLVAGGGDRLPLAPSWSPDGDWIWFSEAGRDEIVRLYRVPVVGGEVEEVRVRSWEASEPRGTLRLNTTLAGSPAPAATRVSIVDEEGHPIFPAGRQPRFDGQTGTVFFYSDGVVEVEAPAGPVTVRVARGLAAPVESRTVSLQPGVRADMDITLQPVWDARAAGWRSGDQHFHLNYGGPYRLDPEDAWESVAGEDLDVVTPLVGNLHERLGEQALFGWGPRGEAPIVRFGQEVRSHFLGHLGLIGTTELFWPWVWGPGYQVYGRDDRTNAEVTAHARAQGGLASYVHPSGEDPFADPAAPGLPVELVADGVLGDVQAMEIACLWTDEVGTAEVWYHLLNLGHPVAATAGSDAMLNFYRTMAPGSTRAYVLTGAASDFDAFLEGLKAGRSFVTNGPLVEFTVEGATPGETTPADGEAEWSLALHTAVGVETVDIIVNGEVVDTRAVGEGAHHRFEGTVPIPGGGWVAVRVLGPETLAWPAMDSYAFAHSSPVWIGGVGSVDDGAARRSAEVLLPALLGARASLERAYAGTDIPELRARFDEAQAALEGWLGGGS